MKKRTNMANALTALSRNKQRKSKVKRKSYVGKGTRIVRLIIPLLVA